MQETMTSRVVVINRAPPKRAMPGNWRKNKTHHDRHIWQECMDPVRALLDRGMRIVSVHIDWGTSVPLTSSERERIARDLCACGTGCEFTERAGTPGRGETTLMLEPDWNVDDRHPYATRDAFGDWQWRDDVLVSTDRVHWQSAFAPVED